MNKIVIIGLLFFFAVPLELPAFRDHHPAVTTLGSVSPSPFRARQINNRLKGPIKLPVDQWDPGRQVRKVHQGHRPAPSGRGPHSRYLHWRPAVTTVVREIQPIIIVNTPPPAPPVVAPEPQKMWVPPVMEMRTQPGYWDYGIKKVWMGDHWRYEQDREVRTWVPASQVAFVKQAGYWKVVE